MSNELTTTQANGPALFRASTDAAGLCREIVVATARNIQGRKYVQVEGWQAIAIAHGCVASAGSVERIDGGYRAIGRVIRMDSGQEISTAEGFVGDDESMWAKRPEYARRAMAQTRAISRACRSAFAHVVVMMNAGLSTTPAEEVPPGGFDDDAPAPAPLDLASIEQAADMPALKAAFDALNKKHRDADSRAKITAAKDRRKAILQQPANTVIDGETGEVI
jgi:hypothetical protein